MPQDIMLSSLWHLSQSTKACGAWDKLLTSHDKAECQKNRSREEPNLGMGVNSLEGMEDSHNTDEQKARMHYEELLVQKDKEINLLKLRIIAQKHDQDITVNLFDRTTNDTISDIDSAVESSCQSKSSILASKHTQLLLEVKQEAIKKASRAEERARAAEEEKEAAHFKLECPICFELDGDRYAIVPCGHVMCSKCNDRYIQNICPSCQYSIAFRLKLHK